MNPKACVFFLAVALSLLLAYAATAVEPQKTIIRWPAVAELSYPAEPEVLLATVKKFYDAAEVPDVPARLSAVLASPAPYGLAGPTSAHAFKSLQPGQYTRVIIIAPGHGPTFENCSVPAVDVFITPLGPVALDAAAVRYILYSPMFQAHQVNYEGGRRLTRVHEFEFAIETLLPYLQERLLEFQLVPILIGDLRDPEGVVRENTIATVADTIRSIINERTLVVVSSSFTQYGEAYGNVPFKENITENIARLDRMAFEHLLNMDIRGFRAYLNETHNVIDGKDCIQILMKLLPNSEPRILAYETSATLTKSTTSSVSYAAFTFHDPSQPPLSAQPDKVRPLTLRRPEMIATPPAEALPPDSDAQPHASKEQIEGVPSQTE
jgi:MEMO1 family protein